MEDTPSSPVDTSPAMAQRARFAYFNTLLRRFTPSERLALYVCAIALAASVFVMLTMINSAFLVTVPEYGGSLVEGSLGSARFVNPVLASSGADRDMTALVYSGLLRSGADGSFVPDLAEKYTVSEDGTAYTFTLRADATFHDGTPVTSTDVAFTVRQAQNTALKSPRQADWMGVEVETPDARTIVFTLPHAYAPFLENATMGILPEHLWNNVADQDFAFHRLNTEPVGSGPYRVLKTHADDTGAVVRYDLAPFAHFTLGSPHLRRITLIFYPEAEALKAAFEAHEVSAIAGINPSDVQDLLRQSNAAVTKVTLPRVFGVFFNQNHNAALADLSVRKALDAATDKHALVDNILNGYGVVLDGPSPRALATSATAVPATVATESTSTNATSTVETRADRARDILASGGWKHSDAAGTWSKAGVTLSFTLATADEPELVATAERLAEYWRAAGIKVDVRTYPITNFNTTILRPRAYDAILFGEVVGRSNDLFAFWHSSQRNDPGLNLALYASPQADALLSRARAETDAGQRATALEQFAALLQRDVPAVFLYSPELLYILPSSLQGVAIGEINTPAERFLNVYQWYTQTERVWSVFAK